MVWTIQRRRLGMSPEAGHVRAWRQGLAWDEVDDEEGRR